MAARQFVCHVAVLILLTLEGCQSEQPECGVAAGGMAGSPGNSPWQVVLESNSESQCAGSLISSRWVLTAVHCSEILELDIIMGRYNQSKSVKVFSSRTVCHPNYNKKTGENDICLIQLSSPVTFTDAIYPVCLAAENSTFHSGTGGWVTGIWGDEKPSEGKLRMVGNNECSCSHSNLTENMICARMSADEIYPCQEDRGVPLVAKKDNTNVWVQWGLKRFTDNCIQPNNISAYVRVSQYQDWIISITKDSPPGFVTFTSPGVDDDLGFNCHTPQPPTMTTTPTPPPTTSTTPTPPSTPPLTTAVTTTAVEATSTHKCKDKSIFGSSEDLAHFWSTSLCALVLSLHLLGGVP